MLYTIKKWFSTIRENGVYVCVCMYMTKHLYGNSYFYITNLGMILTSLLKKISNTQNVDVWYFLLSSNSSLFTI